MPSIFAIYNVEDSRDAMWIAVGIAALALVSVILAFSIFAAN